MRALILAAGYATRLYPLTQTCPKPLLPIKGRPMIEYILDGVFSLPNITSVDVITNAKFAEKFEIWARTCDRRAPIRVINDGTTGEENRLGAIGDIKFALDRIGYNEDLFIAAGDNFFTFSLEGMHKKCIETGGDIICGRHLDDIETLRRYAVATVDAEDRVTHLVEKPQQPASDIGVYALYMYKANTLPLIKTYLTEGNPPDSPGHFPAWLYKRRPVYMYYLPGECVDIGTAEAYEAYR